MDIPSGLIDEIKGGNCVAMVGAGFSAPVVPQWADLLTEIADSDVLKGDAAAHISSLTGSGTGRDLEAAAQTLRDAMGEDAFTSAMRNRLWSPPLNEPMRRRLELLRGIPFRAVLTTNFDGLLRGTPPGRDAYLGVLRPQGHRWWDRRYWDADRSGAAVVKLHGSVDSPDEVVFTRRDYRRRLYSSPAYSTFLRSVMSTTTVLYLGFSFNDAYLNELRSEVLALLDHRGGDEPVAYAVVADASGAEAAYSLIHEGIHILPFSSDHGRDFSGFDDYLDEIHRNTNPRLLLGDLLTDKMIIWIDLNDHSSEWGMRFLRQAAESADGTASIVHLRDSEEGVKLAAEGADLVITYWGHGLGPDGQAAGEHVMSQIRERHLEVPVVVFASGAHADQNKRRAMQLGATSYEYTWEGLFREINRIFQPGSAH